MAGEPGGQENLHVTGQSTNRLLYEKPRIDRLPFDFFLKKRESTEALQFLAEMKQIKIESLKARHRKASEAHWGRLDTQKEYQDAMTEWKKQMTVWYQAFSDKSKVDIRSIFAAAGLPVSISQDEKGNKTFDLPWEQMNDIETFLKAVAKAKKDSNININSARALAGIFGKENQETLFPRQPMPAEQRRVQDQQSKQAVENVLQKSQQPEYKHKITANQRDRLIAKIDVRAESFDHVFNGIVFDPNTTPEQREMVKNAMRVLPIDLLKNVARVDLLGKEFSGAMCYHYATKGNPGRIGIRTDAFSYDRDTFDRKVRHEVGGHGLMNLLNNLSPELHKELIDRLNSLTQKYPGLLNKDSYSANIISGKNGHYKNNLSKHALDEFFCDRLAEWHLIKAGGKLVPSNRVEANPFSQEEESEIFEICKQAFDSLQQAIKKSKQPKPILNIAQKLGLAKAA